MMMFFMCAISTVKTISRGILRLRARCEPELCRFNIILSVEAILYDSNLEVLKYPFE